MTDYITDAPTTFIDAIRAADTAELFGRLDAVYTAEFAALDFRGKDAVRRLSGCASEELEARELAARTDLAGLRVRAGDPWNNGVGAARRGRVIRRAIELNTKEDS
jgi:hypothetical protein